MQKKKFGNDLNGFLSFGFVGKPVFDCGTKLSTASSLRGAHKYIRPTVFLMFPCNSYNEKL